MEQVEVEITGLVITSRYGTLKSGDILRTDAAFAEHLVNEAGAAKYTKPKSAAKGQKDGGKGDGADAGTVKPSEGLKVEELKEALAAKGIAFPADAKKAELADLLDAPAAE